MTAALPCICTHLKPRHAGETYACRDCPCKRYEMDLQAAPATEADLDLDALLERVRQQAAADNAEFQRVHGHCLGREAKLIGKVVDARNAGESTSARLRRVEQERDELAVRAADLEQVREEFRRLRLVADGYEEDIQHLQSGQDEVIDSLRRQRDELAVRLTHVEGHKDSFLAQRDHLITEVKKLIAERDELRSAFDNLPCGDCWGLGVIPAEAFGRDADGAPERDEEAPCPEGCEIPAWLRAERNDAADDARLLAVAQAELASARAELERLRYSGWIVARDGGRDCGSCGQEIRRGEAYTVATTSDTTTHVHCPEGASNG